MGKETITCKQLGNYQPFNLEQELLKLKRLRNRLVNMPNNKQKFLLLKNYITQYHYLKDLYGEDEFPFEVFNFEQEPIARKYYRLNCEDLFQLRDNIELIKETFGDTRKINEQYGIFTEYYLRKKINPKLGLQLLEEFFNKLPLNINNLFKKVMDGNIYFVSPHYLNTAYDVNYFDKSKIKCSERLNDSYAYYAIAHEMGHCYHFNLLCGRNFYRMIDRETPAIFMEIIFAHFVDKCLYNQDYGIINLFNRQGMFASLLGVCDVFLSAGREFMAINDDEINVKLETNMIVEGDVKYLEEWGCYESKMLEKKEYTEDIYLNWFVYPISNLFAIYFADIYSNDPKEGLRLLKDYITLPPSVTIEEKLKMYDITGDSYKKMIKDVQQYGKRKHLL